MNISTCCQISDPLNYRSPLVDMTSLSYVGLSSLWAIALTIHTGQDDWSMSLNQTTWLVRYISISGKAIQPFD